MTRVVRVIAAVVAVLGVAIWLILNLLSPVSFCDIVLVLDAALDTGTFGASPGCTAGAISAATFGAVPVCV